MVLRTKPKFQNQSTKNIYEMNREEREAVGIQDLPSTLYTALKAMRENDTVKSVR